MQINFYTITEEKNVINKTLTGELIIEGSLKDSTSILTPQIMVKRNDLILDKNYIYIPNFKRFYFITDIVIVGAFFNVSCEVDVLESYKTEILNSEQVISRQETKHNRQLRDEKIQRYGMSFQVVKKIGNTPFNTNFIDESGKGFLSLDRYNFIINMSNNE